MMTIDQRLQKIEEKIDELFKPETSGGKVILDLDGDYVRITFIGKNGYRMAYPFQPMSDETPAYLCTGEGHKITITEWPPKDQRS